MSPLILILIVTSLLAYVAGQLLLKVAMADEDEAETGTSSNGVPVLLADKIPRRKRIAFFTASIACMTVTFFINLGLLQKLDLSFLFPFQGLSVIIVTFGASIFLKERLTATLVIGALLITIGVMLVSTS